MTIDPAASAPGAPGPDGHLDPELMADLYDGLLDDDAAEAARRHLAGCAACADDFALITMDSGVSGQDSPFAAFAAPVPIPTEVAIRIEAALHREPPLTPTAPPTAAPHHSAAPRKTRRFRLVFGSLAGATLVIAGVFGGIAALHHSSESKSSQTSTASGKSSEGGLFSSGSSNDSQVGAAPNAAPNSEPGGASNTREPDRAPSPAGSGNLALTSIEAQAEQLLAKAGQTQPHAAGSTRSGAPDLGSSVCAPAGFRDITPLAEASITYQGRPAELLVYPKLGDPTRADVYVVAAGGCAGAASGDVLYSTVVPRP
jgi:hypothetical protein